MHTHLHTYMHIHTYTHMHTHVHTHTCTHTYTHTHMHAPAPAGEAWLREQALERMKLPPTLLSRAPSMVGNRSAGPHPNTPPASPPMGLMQRLTSFRHSR